MRQNLYLSKQPPRGGATYIADKQGDVIFPLSKNFNPHSGGRDLFQPARFSSIRRTSIWLNR
jgi:hypothetical protein